jgi:putative tricarboxylic transport membrane protein
MEYILSLILGTLYGFLFGIIPVAGAGVGLITIFGFLDIFRAEPYSLVVFTTSLVVAATIGDSFASVVMNIPGASGSAATMVDGFPMTKRGEAARALGAALSTSTVNGILWGALVFMFLPYYAPLILKFGIPEILSFLLLAFASVCFINNKYWFRGILALALGVFLGLVGQNPITGAERWTFGWDYLGGGIQLAPLLAGVLAIPELLEAYQNRHTQERIQNIKTEWQQIWQGFVDSWKHKWDGLRGGLIGAIVGVIPGIGGSVADWLAYGQTVALNKNEKIAFGDGNVKGVIGCEGANNAQKATSYVPTVLFGIPGAPFEAIIIALFLLVGIELGSPSLLNDLSFFDNLASSYMWSLLLSFVLGLFFIRYAVRITNLPFSYYFWPVMALLVWSSVQYTGYWEDYVFFAMCCAFGLALRKYKFSRAALVIGYVLADRLEGTFLQYSKLYDFTDIFTRPISGSLMALTFVAIIYGVFFNKTRIKYV